MNKIQAVIIEDEIPAARLLSTMVVRLRPEWSVTVLPGNVEEAVQWFQINPHPDLIFLDIQLADGNSFDFLSAANPSSFIVFTTAYDQYAIRAFTVNSIDYILKPVDEKRLLDAIVKYENMRTTNHEPVDGYLKNVLDTLQQKDKQYRTRFLIWGTGKFWSLQVADIAYFYSENKIVFAVTHTGKEYTLDISLNKLMEQLDPDLFFRANRQTILSIRAISHAEPYFNGKIVVAVKPPHKTKIIVSEEKLSQFKLWLNY